MSWANGPYSECPQIGAAKLTFLSNSSKRNQVCLCLGERNVLSSFTELMGSLKMVSVQLLIDALQKFLVLGEHLFH